jgi:hypothetical protein
MAVKPLTNDELEAMDHSIGATWPRGVMLVCSCGKIGPPTVVEGHRGRSGNLLCRKKPEAFRTVEEAQERSVEVAAAREEEQRNRIPAAISLVERGHDDETPEPSAVDIAPRPRGRPRGSKTTTTTVRGDGRQQTQQRTENLGPATVRGDGRQPTQQHTEQLGPATVRIGVDLPADAFARYNKVRLDPEYGFSGDPGEYLYACELAFWQMMDWLAGGQVGPISIRLAA